MIESVTRVVSKASNLGQNHGYRTKTPKTRFTVNEKPISTPRLKSFPAEKVKKVEEPAQNSSEIIHQVNSSQGDVLLDHQQSTSQNVTTSDQLIPRNVQPGIENHANHSEPAISSRKENLSVKTPNRTSMPVSQSSIHYLINSYPQQTQSYQINISEQAHHQQQQQQQLFSQPIVQNLGSSAQNIKLSQPINYYEQGSNSQTQCNQYTPQRLIPHYQNQPRFDNLKGMEAKKTTLKFTPAMIKDQELLVMTMKQQGIREDLMRRQFDTLLAEQRKQLLYFEQLKNHASDESLKSLPSQKVYRKISKIQEDGKPEWMWHITPPRIPYCVVEQMKEERQFESQMSPKSHNEMTNQTCCQVENCDRNSCNLPWQMNLANDWQQQPQQYFHTANNVSPGIQPPHIHALNNISNVNQPQQCHAPNNIHSVIGNQPPNLNALTNIQDVSQTQLCHAPNNMHNVNQELHCGYQSYWQQQQPTIRNETQMLSEIRNSGDDELQRNKRAVEPLSLLKMRLYKEVIKRQKQNNGLQDPEMIKEAMEALKNPANRQVLEYLDNLNKKREKPVSLNGVQDPQKMASMNHEMHPCQQIKSKIVSANGLENVRNPNNLLPSRLSILRQKKTNDFVISEYPKQRTTPRNNYCSTVMPERENETATSTNQNLNTHGLLTNRQTFAQNSHQIRPEHVSNYLSYADHASGIVHDHSYPGNNIHTGNPGNLQNHNQPRFYAGETMMTSNNQMGQGFFDPQRNINSLCEPVIIGGIKYLARKPEYSHSPYSAAQHYPQNNGNGINSAIACQ